MSEDNFHHIVCPHCGTVNRLSRNHPAAEAKCGHCHKPIFTHAAIPVSTERFEKHLRHDSIPIAVDFWAEWCGTCKFMAPIFSTVAAEMEPEVRFLKIDTETEHQLALKYDIQNIPMLMLFRDGKPVAHRAGVMDAHALRAWIRQYAGLPMQAE